MRANVRVTRPDRHIALDYQKDWFARQGDYLAKPVELRFFEMLSSYDK